MKFEHILQIYWSKGFLTNGKLQTFQTSFKHVFASPGGFSHAMKNLLISRFELYNAKKNPDQGLITLSPVLPMSMNILFSQITSVNSGSVDLTRYNLLRLYLIKTTRGRSHALGKPSRGQRTWSNAWTAYNCNNTTRSFISAYQKIQKENEREEKINYKLIKKKTMKKKKKDAVSKVKIKINHWF